MKFLNNGSGSSSERSVMEKCPLLLTWKIIYWTSIFLLSLKETTTKKLFFKQLIRSEITDTKIIHQKTRTRLFFIRVPVRLDAKKKKKKVAVIVKYEFKTREAASMSSEGHLEERWRPAWVISRSGRIRFISQWKLTAETGVWRKNKKIIIIGICFDCQR